MVRKILAIFLAILIGFMPEMAQAQSFSISQLPIPGSTVGLSASFEPILVKGLVVFPKEPLKFRFIVDSGKDKVDQARIKEESERMVKYFLAAVTVPEQDQWVNLSPLEHDRMIAESLGATDLGRDMLAQDYVLKQFTSSMLNPDFGVGKEFWTKMYAEAQAKFGTTDVPIDTFSKVWIMPDSAEVFVHENAVYVTKAHLKVMLDADYQVTQKSDVGRQTSDEKTGANPLSSDVSRLSSDNAAAQSLSPSQLLVRDIMREVILPAIENEVNTGANFSTIRQIYYAGILARWYRDAIKDSLMASAYMDKGKTRGVDLDDKTLKEQIYQRYIEAYKKGVVDFIREENDAVTGDIIPRKYFSGGVERVIPTSDEMATTTDPAKVPGPGAGEFMEVDFAMSNGQEDAPRESAMSSSLEKAKSLIELGLAGEDKVNRWSRDERSRDQREYQAADESNYEIPRLIAEGMIRFYNNPSGAMFLGGMEGQGGSQVSLSDRLGSAIIFLKYTNQSQDRIREEAEAQVILDAFNSSTSMPDLKSRAAVGLLRVPFSAVQGLPAAREWIEAQGRARTYLEKQLDAGRDVALSAACILLENVYTSPGDVNNVIVANTALQQGTSLDLNSPLNKAVNVFFTQAHEFERGSWKRRNVTGSELDAQQREIFVQIAATAYRLNRVTPELFSGDSLLGVRPVDVFSDAVVEYGNGSASQFLAALMVLETDADLSGRSGVSVVPNVSLREMPNNVNRSLKSDQAPIVLQKEKGAAVIDISSFLEMIEEHVRHSRPEWDARVNRDYSRSWLNFSPTWNYGRQSLQIFIGQENQRTEEKFEIILTEKDPVSHEEIRTRIKMPVENLNQASFNPKTGKLVLTVSDSKAAISQIGHDGKEIQGGKSFEEAVTYINHILAWHFQIVKAGTDPDEGIVEKAPVLSKEGDTPITLGEIIDLVGYVRSLWTSVEVMTNYEGYGGVYQTKIDLTKKRYFLDMSSRKNGNVLVISLDDGGPVITIPREALHKVEFDKITQSLVMSVSSQGAEFSLTGKIKQEAGASETTEEVLSFQEFLRVFNETTLGKVKLVEAESPLRVEQFTEVVSYAVAPTMPALGLKRTVPELDGMNNGDAVVSLKDRNGGVPVKVARQVFERALVILKPGAFGQRPYLKLLLRLAESDNSIDVEEFKKSSNDYRILRDLILILRKHQALVGDVDADDDTTWKNLRIDPEMAKVFRAGISIKRSLQRGDNRLRPSGPEVGMFKENLVVEKAMNQNAAEAALVNGGIDIQNIFVAKTGSGETIRFDEAALQELVANGFDGFTPIFLGMTPLDNPLAAMGVK